MISLAEEQHKPSCSQLRRKTYLPSLMVIRFNEAALLKEYSNFKHWSRQNECRDGLCSKKERNFFDSLRLSLKAHHLLMLGDVLIIWLD